MAIEITVPRLGWSMEEGVFREWLVEVGDRVQPGQALFVLESDKAAQEVESFDAGTLAVPDGAPKSGETVAVGQLLGFLLAEGETLPAYRPPEPSPLPAESGILTPGQDHPATTRAVNSRRNRDPSTPRARRAAQELDVDLGSIQGSGRGGRIRERDILKSTRTIQSGGSGTVAFMTARALTRAIESLATQLAAHKAGYCRADLLARLVQAALREFPSLNAGQAIELGKSFGFWDFTGRRIERWTPELPPGCLAALGIGRPTGNPAEYPLNLSFDSSHIRSEEAAAFIDFLCEVIESPLLGLVR